MRSESGEELFASGFVLGTRLIVSVVKDLALADPR
jgi:hypothetical protein